MKAARLHGYGEVEQFRIEHVPEPTPGKGEVVVKIEAAGLNPADAAFRQGWMHEWVPLEFPATLGADAAGTVAAVGEGVTDFAAGDRVVAHVPPHGKGTYAEYVVVAVAGLARLPASVSFEAGATLPLASITGRHAVDLLGVKAGDRVLISGALGAVGRAAVQYLKEIGAVPVAGVRADRLPEGRAVAGEAVDIATPPDAPSFDFAISTAAPVAGNVVQFVRDGGKLASAVMTPPDALANRNVNVIQVVGSAADPAHLQQAADAAGRGELAIPVAHKFKLDDIAAAHQALAVNPSGKVLIVP